jgi:hypothetical protein
MHVKTRHGGWLALALAATFAFGGAAWAEEETDASVVQEVLGILKERGIVDEDEYARLATKNASFEARQEEGFLSRIDWSGDLRLRMESFWFGNDPTDEDKENRYRGRYRVRVMGVVPINEMFTAGFRFVSANGVENRSTNRTLGNGADFDYDILDIDLAYLEARPPSGWLPETTSAKLTAGKVKNPFTWKNGKDYMIWDHDVTPEGGGVQIGYEPSEQMKLYLNSGYYVLLENSGGKDAGVLGVQSGAGFAPVEDLEFGLRGTWYKWNNVNADCSAGSMSSSCFYDRAADWGNINGGLSDGSSVNVVEGAWYARWSGIENWPLLVYGHYAHNFSAEEVSFPGITTAKDDDGWGGGIEIGDKKKYVKLGAGYYRLEANFSPAQFIDSDLFDGFTNRKGWTVYLSRQIAHNTDLNLTLFKSHDIRDGGTPGGPYDTTGLDNDHVSDGGSNRFRLQTDVVVKF